jgi:hypothetical protein
MSAMEVKRSRKSPQLINGNGPNGAPRKAGAMMKIVKVSAKTNDNRDG